LRLAEHIPSRAPRQSESGIHDARDISTLREAGYTAFLVGEHLMKSGDPAAALKKLVAHDPQNLRHHQPEDATAAIAGGATAIGFNFYRRSPRYLAPERARGIQTAPGVRRVGVFVDEARERVEEIARIAALDVGATARRRNAGRLPRLAGGNGKPCAWEEIFDLSRWLDCPAEALLLDGPASGVAFDWRLAVPAPKPLILAEAWMPPMSPRPWRWPILGRGLPARASKARRAGKTPKMNEFSKRPRRR